MSGEFRRTEAFLGRVLPARLVTLLLAEPRGFVAVARWIRGGRPEGRVFSHHREVAIILWVVVVSLVVEGVIVDVLLRAILGPSHWVWIALGLHVYAVFMIVAVFAGMVTRPHSLDGAVLRLRTGLGFEVQVPVSAIEAADTGRFPGFDRSGWKVDADGIATMAVSAANMRIVLASGATVVVNGVARNGIRAVHVTVDEPRRLAAAVADVRTSAAAGQGH